MKSKGLIVFASVGFAGFLLGSSPAWAQVSLGAAEEFTALGSSAVTATSSVVEGRVGVGLGGAVTQTASRISGTVHLGDTIAQKAHQDFLAAYAAIALLECDFDLTGQPLGGKSLTPGVYCFDAAVTETGSQLTLVGPRDGTWIFKVGTLGTGALTGTNFTVLMPGGEKANNNVFWWTADAVTLTDSVFIGTVLSGAPVTVTRGTLDGQALATTAVTMTGTSVCGGPQIAVFDEALGAPRCATVSASCDSGPILLNGRDNVGPEPNQPNTINGSCADGALGIYHVDESNDRLRVSTLDGSPLGAGKTVRIDATVWAWETGEMDSLDLYYAPDANNPDWMFIATLTPAVTGAQVLSATYTLPAGCMQAVRARFRYQGSVSSCGTGNYDDHDDLVFAAQ